MFSRTIKKSNIKEKLPLSPVDNSPELTALDRRPRKKLKTNDNNTHSVKKIMKNLQNLIFLYRLRM